MTANLLRSVAIAIAVIGTVSAYAQSPAGCLCQESDAGKELSSAQFEVASIKVSAPDTQPNLGVRAGGFFFTANTSLLQLITIAHQMRHSFQVVGTPTWVRTARYDIQAKAPAGVTMGPLATLGPPSPALQMLQALLRDRFSLKVHRETREMPAYALVTARADKRLGAQLTRSSPDTDCAALLAARKLVRPSAPPASGVVSPCLILFYPGRMVVGTQPLEQLANHLSSQMNRMVIDRTGLIGAFDFDLTWTPDLLASSPSVGAQSTSAETVPTDAALVTAIQEQLGLKLESIRAPIEVLVVDSISEPTAN